MSDTNNHRTTATFGTLPVFITAISTILGAILFLRFGYAVGHLGFIGVIGIIFLGHMVTIPTAMAVAEIATNQKVQGGGAYYIISRSFGMNVTPLGIRFPKLDHHTRCGRAVMIENLTVEVSDFPDRRC